MSNGTALGKAHMARVAQLSCTVADRNCRGRTTVHHKQGDKSLNQKASDFETMAICDGHHLHGPFSIEAMGIKAWERKHGQQEHHLEITRRKLAVTFPEFNPLNGERL